MSNPFKAAQRVTCVNKEDCSKLKNGKDYTIKYTDGHLVCLNEVTGGYFYWRFADTSTMNALPKRDKSGRFISPVSANSKPISTNNIIPFPTMAKSNNIPAVLKKGAIYSVLGGSCAHFKMAAYDDYVIMVSHGKPSLVKKERLRIASPEEVKYYLGDAR